MWGTKANIWSEKEYAAGSMKWHLVDEASLNSKMIEVGYGERKRAVPRTYGKLDCGRKGNNSTGYYSDLPLVLRETLNISQSNICAYCKKARMKELELQSVQI